MRNYIENVKAHKKEIKEALIGDAMLVVVALTAGIMMVMGV